MELVQIVPTLPPSLSGVGDYAALLAGRLESAHGVRTRFVVGDPGWAGNEAAVAPFAARSVPARQSEELRRMLSESAAPILLHYVGYGYQHRGCPFWLVDAMEMWKRHTGGRLIVLFHETSADNEPIWSTAFWTAPFQRRLAARLGRLADVCRMTTGPAATQMRRWLGARGRQPGAAEVTPVFSTLGEPADLLPWAAREPRMIVFGSRSWRVEAYTTHLDALTDACRRLGIESIADVGAPVDLPGRPEVPIQAMGALEASAACELFARSRAGFFTYPVPFLGKSTILAAYCACGLVPVTPATNAQPSPEGLRAGEHYLFAGPGSSPDWPDPAGVATAARNWYDQHRLDEHARQIAAQAFGASTNPGL